MNIFLSNVSPEDLLEILILSTYKYWFKTRLHRFWTSCSNPAELSEDSLLTCWQYGTIIHSLAQLEVNMRVKNWMNMKPDWPFCFRREHNLVRCEVHLHQWNNCVLFPLELFLAGAYVDDTSFCAVSSSPVMSWVVIKA